MLIKLSLKASALISVDIYMKFFERTVILCVAGCATVGGQTRNMKYEWKYI
jgi:hypothetical protein